MSIVVAEKQICTQEGQNEIIIVASTVAKLVYFEMLKWQGIIYFF
jgi:hypothetical protein